jgi:hypothetical protein
LENYNNKQGNIHVSDQSSGTAPFDVLILPSQRFQACVAGQDPYGALEALFDYFRVLRTQDMIGNFNDDDVAGGVRYWVQGIDILSSASPAYAHIGAIQAYQDILTQPGNMPCHAVILNTVCIKIIDSSHSALETSLAEASASNSIVTRIVKNLESVIKSTAPHIEHQDFNDTFYEALCAWEKIVFSHYVPPVSRVDLLNDLDKWEREFRRPILKLRERLDQLKALITVFPNGACGILRAAEEMADQLADEVKAHKEKGVTDLSTAFAIKADVPAAYSAQFTAIEAQKEAGNYKLMTRRLLSLLEDLLGDGEGDKEQDVRIYSYWMARANDVLNEDQQRATRLAVAAVQILEDQFVDEESLQLVVYGFALAAIDIESSQEFMDMVYELMNATVDYGNERGIVFERSGLSVVGALPPADTPSPR